MFKTGITYIYFLKIILILLIVFLMQVTLLEKLERYHIDIDLIFLSIAFYSIFLGLGKGVMAAGIFGGVYDTISPNTFGLYLCSYLVISILIYINVDRFHKDTLLGQFFIIFISIIFFKLIHIGLTFLIDDLTIINSESYTNLFYNVICTTLFSPILFFTLKKIHNYE